MQTFKLFLEEQEFVDFVINEFDQSSDDSKKHLWHAKKSQIMQMWRNLKSDTPVYLTPMEKTGKTGKKSYGEDGIRIMGSWPFIASVLARLKEILVFENPNTRLRLIFRGVEGKNSRPDRPSFVFYVNLEKRGS
jgi:hypothetical protein